MFVWTILYLKPGINTSSRTHTKQQTLLLIYLRLRCSRPLVPSPPSEPDPARDQVATPEPGGFPPRSSDTDGSS